MSDAVNSGDIAPNTLPIDNATAGATPYLYLSFYNGGSDISFGSNTPTVQVTDTSGFASATTCELDVYAKNGGPSLAWTQIATGAISGTSVTISSIPLGNQQTLDLKSGQQMVAIACK